MKNYAQLLSPIVRPLLAPSQLAEYRRMEANLEEYHGEFVLAIGVHGIQVEYLDAHGAHNDSAQLKEHYNEIRSRLFEKIFDVYIHGVGGGVGSVSDALARLVVNDHEEQALILFHAEEQTDEEYE